MTLVHSLHLIRVSCLLFVGTNCVMRLQHVIKSFQLTSWRSFPSFYSIVLIIVLSCQQSMAIVCFTRLHSCIKCWQLVFNVRVWYSHVYCTCFVFIVCQCELCIRNIIYYFNSSFPSFHSRVLIILLSCQQSMTTMRFISRNIFAVYWVNQFSNWLLRNYYQLSNSVLRAEVERPELHIFTKSLDSKIRCRTPEMKYLTMIMTV